MTWGKVSDDLHSHPKWTGASPNAKALWVTALSYASGYLTDGRIDRDEHLPTVAAETFGMVPSAMKKARAAAAELVERSLWETTSAGWRFHDWKDNNPSAAQVRRRKKHDKRREWLHKTADGRALKRLVRARDGEMCSWCGNPVRWGANKAPDGGTYDHVRPDGPDSPDNVVIACNSCNGTKRDIDADEIGFHLRDGHALAPDATPSASSGTPADSIAIESPRMTHAGAGRVGIGSGRDGVGASSRGGTAPADGALSGSSITGPSSFSSSRLPEPPPPPSDHDYRGDHP